MFGCLNEGGFGGMGCLGVGIVLMLGLGVWECRDWGWGQGALG